MASLPSSSEIAASDELNNTPPSNRPPSTNHSYYPYIHISRRRNQCVGRQAFRREANQRIDVRTARGGHSVVRNLHGQVRVRCGHEPPRNAPPEPAYGSALTQYGHATQRKSPC